MALGAVLFVATVGAALAAEAASTVVIPYGDLPSEAAHIASAIIVPILLLLLSKLTGPVGLFLRTFLGDWILTQAGRSCCPSRRRAGPASSAPDRGITRRRLIFADGARRQSRTAKRARRTHKSSPPRTMPSWTSASPGWSRRSRMSALPFAGSPRSSIGRGRRPGR